MSAKTSIEWCDSTWNPVRGCSRVSPGCVNCYAERTAARFTGIHTEQRQPAVLGRQNATVCEPVGWETNK